MMTKQEYGFLTGRWDGPKGVEWNSVFGFCRSFGWCSGLDRDGHPVLTRKGEQALKEYEENLAKTENSS